MLRSFNLYALLLFLSLLLHGCTAYYMVSAARRDEARAEARAQARLGLGTAWGEKRISRISDTRFERATPDQPASVSRVYYNDEAGMAAMLRHAPSSESLSSMRLYGSGLIVKVQDEYGESWPTRADGKDFYVTGQPGRRYAIRIENRAPARVEVVVSVDGLDVLDGQAAAYSKRGYVLAPNGSVLIEGFRSSAQEVAAFRFSSVEASYAERKYGDSRNIGVIGIAVFNEQDAAPPLEIQRREAADPFPGRYATPP